MENRKTAFRTITEVKSEDGVLVAPITVREGRDGRAFYTFAIMRNLPQDGDDLRQTHWLQKRHVQAARQLLDKVEEMLDAEIEVARVAR